MNLVSLSKGYSSSFLKLVSSDSLVIPALAPAISNAISVGSPVTCHSPFPIRFPRFLFLGCLNVLIVAVEQITPHFKVSINDFSFCGFTERFSVPFVSPPFIL